MTTVLGINTALDRSSAVSLTQHSISAALEQQFTHVPGERAFPHMSISSFKHNTWDVVATTNCITPAFRTAVRQHTTADIVRVDYREALAMATISSRDWESCAIICIDSDTCSLGYYSDRSFYWVRDFERVNSLALFSSAATRFLGYDAVYGEDDARFLARYGTPLWQPWIERYGVSIEDGSYRLLRDYSRGVGRGVPNADIAASVQATISKIMVALVRWLAEHYTLDNLVIVGRAAANYISNTAIASTGLYKQIATLPISGGASAALGAVALVQRPLVENAYLGIDVDSGLTPDIVAQRLLAGQKVQFRHGKQEFSDNSFINRNELYIPFAPLIDAGEQYHICQERDFSLYYSCPANPTHGQYLSTVSTDTLPFKLARTITVASNRNPFINRVLEITRASGYPILLSRPLQ